MTSLSSSASYLEPPGKLDLYLAFIQCLLFGFIDNLTESYKKDVRQLAGRVAAMADAGMEVHTKWELSKVTRRLHYRAQGSELRVPEAPSSIFLQHV